MILFWRSHDACHAHTRLQVPRSYLVDVADVRSSAAARRANGVLLILEPTNELVYFPQSARGPDRVRRLLGYRNTMMYKWCYGLRADAE
jgi:hypothetical protein